VLCVIAADDALSYNFLHARMLRAGVVFGGVCESVCLSVKNLENYWPDIVLFQFRLYILNGMT